MGMVLIRSKRTLLLLETGSSGDRKEKEEGESGKQGERVKKKKRGQLEDRREQVGAAAQAGRAGMQGAYRRARVAPSMHTLIGRLEGACNTTVTCPHNAAGQSRLTARHSLPGSS